MARRKTMAKKRPSKVAKRKAGSPFKQLVITLHPSNGEITKIEHLAATGQRRAVSDAEFATLAGDDDLEDFSDLIEAAYAAGVQDGFEDAIGGDHFAGPGQPHRGQGESKTRHVLRAGVRRSVLRRALRRGAVRQAVAARHNGAQGA